MKNKRTQRREDQRRQYKALKKTLLEYIDERDELLTWFNKLSDEDKQKVSKFEHENLVYNEMARNLNQLEYKIYRAKKIIKSVDDRNSQTLRALQTRR